MFQDTKPSISRYLIKELIGKGGMAQVYRAYDPLTQRYVAIKVIGVGREQDQVSRKRFELEAKIMASLSHPNIVPVLDYGYTDGKPYLVMEYIKGGSLSDIVDKQIPYEKAAQLLVPIAKALDYIHHHKIIHRDIKPGNILLSQAGTPLLSDFGIARLTNPEETMDLTSKGSTGIGTPHYMAPEQALHKDIDLRADIYSLGMVFYKLITGSTAFHADTPYAVIMKQVSEVPPSARAYVPGLPKIVDEVLNKALAKKPEDRFQTMEEFARVLEELAAKKLNIPLSLPKRRFNVLCYGLPFLALFSVLAASWFLVKGFNQPSTAAFTSAIKKSLSTIPTESVELNNFQIATTAPAPTATPTSVPSLTLVRPFPTVTALDSATTSTLAVNTPTALSSAWKANETPYPNGSGRITSENARQLSNLGEQRGVPAVTSQTEFIPGPDLFSYPAKDGILLRNTSLDKEQFVKPGVDFRDFSISSDGQKLAVAVTGDKVQIWNLNTGSLANSFFTGKISRLMLSPDGSRLYTGSMDAIIRVWNTGDGKLADSLTGNTSGIKTLVFSWDNRLLVSGADSGAISFWNIASGEKTPFYRTALDAVSCATFSPNNKILAIGSQKGKVILMDPTTRETLHSIISDKGITSLSFSPDEKIIALTFNNGQVQLWDIASNTLLVMLSHPDKQFVRSFFMEGGNILALFAKEGDIYFYGNP